MLDYHEDEGHGETNGWKQPSWEKVMSCLLDLKSSNSNWINLFCDNLIYIDAVVLNSFTSTQNGLWKWWAKSSISQTYNLLSLPECDAWTQGLPRACFIFTFYPFLAATANLLHSAMSRCTGRAYIFVSVFNSRIRIYLHPKIVLEKIWFRTSVENIC